MNDNIIVRQRTRLKWRFARGCQIGMVWLFRGRWRTAIIDLKILVAARHTVLGLRQPPTVFAYRACAVHVIVAVLREFRPGVDIARVRRVIVTYERFSFLFINFFDKLKNCAIYFYGSRCCVVVNVILLILSCRSTDKKERFLSEIRILRGTFVIEWVDFWTA